MRHCFESEAYLHNFFLLLSAEMKAHADLYLDKTLSITVQPPAPFSKTIQLCAPSLEQLKGEVHELLDNWDWGTKKRSKRSV